MPRCGRPRVPLSDPSGAGRGRAAPEKESGKRKSTTRRRGVFRIFPFRVPGPKRKTTSEISEKQFGYRRFFVYLPYAAARASDEPPARGIRWETAAIVFGADPAACIRRRRTFRPGGPARTVSCADRRRSFPVRFGGGRSPCVGERSGRRAVDFRRIVAFEIPGGEFCILFVEMKASKTTFCYEPS